MIIPFNLLIAIGIYFLAKIAYNDFKDMNL